MKGTKRFCILWAWVMAATVFLLTDYVSAAEKVYKWRAVTHQLVGTARYKGTVVPFCEMVKKASNGRLIIEPYGAGVLFPVPESFDAVRDGVVQMAMVWGGTGLARIRSSPCREAAPVTRSWNLRKISIFPKRHTPFWPKYMKNTM